MTVMFRLNRGVLQALNAKAKREGMPLADLVRAVLDREVQDTATQGALPPLSRRAIPAGPNFAISDRG